jgi:hypothetical protein
MSIAFPQNHTIPEYLPEKAPSQLQPDPRFSRAKLCVLTSIGVTMVLVFGGGMTGLFGLLLTKVSPISFALLLLSPTIIAQTHLVAIAVLLDKDKSPQKADYSPIILPSAPDLDEEEGASTPSAPDLDEEEGAPTPSAPDLD